MALARGALEILQAGPARRRAAPPPCRGGLWSEYAWLKAYLNFMGGAEMGGSKRMLDLAAWTARRLPMPLKRALYRFPPLAGAIRRGLNRLAPVG